MTESPMRQAAREMQETTCPHCKGTKKERRSFCYKDWHKLPKPLQQALYKGFNDGYVEAYFEAKEYLQAEHPVTAPITKANTFATSSQVAKALGLCRELRISSDMEINRYLGLECGLEELTIVQASQFITHLQAMKDGGRK